MFIYIELLLLKMHIELENCPNICLFMLMLWFILIFKILLVNESSSIGGALWQWNEEYSIFIKQEEFQAHLECKDSSYLGTWDETCWVALHQNIRKNGHNSRSTEDNFVKWKNISGSHSDVDFAQRRLKAQGRKGTPNSS